MTPERLEEIRERVDAVNDPDIWFSIAARDELVDTDVPELLDEVDRLRVGIEALIEPRAVRDTVSGEEREIAVLHVRADALRALLNPEETP